MHFSHIRRSIQPALAVAIHSAIWNWIEAYPTDFILLHQKGKRIDIGAETLFDIFHSVATANDGPSKAKAFWPTQAALLLLCPDILDKAIHGESGSSVTKKASCHKVLLCRPVTHPRLSLGCWLYRYAPEIGQSDLHG
jgi:hypothetical protein